MKIFGIGLSKTGTTSLARALEALGYKVKDNLGINRYTRGDLRAIDRGILDTYDAFTDTPIPSFYRELDAEYPDSKFVLTVREADGWLLSCKKQFTQKQVARQTEGHNQLFLDLYGCTVFDEQKFKSGYENFVAGVLEYFQERPQDLLVLNVSAGEGWEKLCPFLGRSVPDQPFPKANVTRVRWIDIGDIVSIATKAGEQTYQLHQKVCKKRTPSRERRPYETLSVLLGRATTTMRGGATGILHRARRRAHRTIVKALRALNPHVPVISTESDAVPFSARQDWNHFWLVDPVDSDEAFLSSEGQYTINIALVEDRKPIIGVVHVPATNTTYYAMAGRNALKMEGGREPRVLERQSTCGEATKANVPLEIQEPSRPSTALRMCLSAEGKRSIDEQLADTMEWETAAAHVVLNCTGMKVRMSGTSDELTYNNDDMANQPIIID